MDTRPIGMFDSGSGGLTVLKEYTKLLPNEDFIYFGDTAHLPYGDKSPEKIREYCESIVKFLIEKDVKMIVIACGTASANAYSYLKEHFDIEIKSIIEPTASSLKDSNIGVIATKATIRSNAWENAIKTFNPEANITSIACPLFVPLIEEGLIENHGTDYIIKEYMDKLDVVTNNITSVVMGCTHYPLLSSKLRATLPEDVKLINVGEISAQNTLNYLVTNNMQNDISHKGNIELHSSDNFTFFKENAKTLGFVVD